MKTKHLISCLSVAVLIVGSVLTTAAAPAVATPTTMSVCSPDGTHVAETTLRGDIQYVRTSDGTVEQTFYLCNVHAIEFSRDGRFLAASGGPGATRAKIKVWRISDGKQLGEIVVANNEGAKLLALSLDGSTIIGASSNGRVDAWLVVDGKPRWSHTFAAAVESMTVAPERGTIVVQLAGGTKKELDLTNGRHAQTIAAAATKAKEPAAAK